MSLSENKQNKNEFGGLWTVEKLEILETYARQFLKVFKNKSSAKLLYFDGFAGSGEISHINNGIYNTIEGSTKRILDINEPRSFNIYYFVEKNKPLADSLQEMINRDYQSKKAYVVSKDCNEKLRDLAIFLNSAKGKHYKVLAFIDPKGMQLKWESLEALKGLNIDLWILNPTSGCNRLLKTNGNISTEWKNRLKLFLGIKEDEIMDYFYKPSSQQNLFGFSEIEKERDSIQKLHELYATRIKQNIFKYVTEPKVLRDSKGRILFHFFMATNNDIALRIGNSVVNPKFTKI
ncbi:MAG: three-Cys-motif partner protein TcmP [Mariniphaga sp.]|nr:three-Cys-motif partner protein TcmP [Mariniphaga sp.]